MNTLFDFLAIAGMFAGRALLRTKYRITWKANV